MTEKKRNRGDDIEDGDISHISWGRGCATILDGLFQEVMDGNSDAVGLVEDLECLVGIPCPDWGHPHSDLSFFNEADCRDVERRVIDSLVNGSIAALVRHEDRVSGGGKLPSTVEGCPELGVYFSESLVTMIGNNKTTDCPFDAAVSNLDPRSFILVPATSRVEDDAFTTAFDDSASAWEKSFLTLERHDWPLAPRRFHSWRALFPALYVGPPTSAPRGYGTALRVKAGTLIVFLVVHRDLSSVKNRHELNLVLHDLAGYSLQEAKDSGPFSSRALVLDAGESIVLPPEAVYHLHSPEGCIASGTYFLNFSMLHRSEAVLSCTGLPTTGLPLDSRDLCFGVWMTFVRMLARASTMVEHVSKSLVALVNLSANGPAYLPHLDEDHARQVSYYKLMLGGIGLLPSTGSLRPFEHLACANAIVLQSNMRFSVGRPHEALCLDHRGQKVSGRVLTPNGDTDEDYLFKGVEREAWVRGTCVQTWLVLLD